MKKMTPKIIIGLASALLLVACNGQTSEPTSSFDPTSSSDSSGTESNDSGSSSSNGIISSDISAYSEPPLVVEGEITLRLQGNLFTNGYRSVYAIYSDKTAEISWSVSNEDLVTPSVLEDTRECYLMAKSTAGTFTVTASLASDSSVSTSMDIEIKSGEPITEELLSPFQGSAKFTTKWDMLNYDDDLNSTVYGTEYFQTIYEEYGNNTDTDISTDAYQMTSWDENGNITYESKWVKSGSGALSKEYVNSDNEVGYEKYYNEDDEDVKFRNTYYVNMFGAVSSYYGESFVKPEEWQTIDGGKTYHFAGSLYYLSTYLLYSLTLYDNISADDMYLDFTDDSPKFVCKIDPYRDSDDSKLYGSEIVSVLSDAGTATIDHVLPYEHESYHDDIEMARKAMAASTNYVGIVTIDGGSKVVYTYTEDTIDVEVLSSNGLSVSHTGAHKTADNEYYEYTVKNGEVVIDEYHHSVWNSESVTRYPTFDFASEIFDSPNSSLKHNAREGAESFIYYTSYFPISAYLIEEFSDATLTLDGNGHISQVYSDIEYTDGTVGSVQIDFSNFGTASVNLDFSSASEPVAATTWEEAAPNLYSAFVRNGAQNDIPYKYCEFGWENTEDIGWLQRDPHYFYFSTGKFAYDTKAEWEPLVTQWIEEYQALLVENGFTLSSEVETRSPNEDAAVYTKGDISISVRQGRYYTGGSGQNWVTILYYNPNMTYTMAD